MPRPVPYDMGCVQEVRAVLLLVLSIAVLLRFSIAPNVSLTELFTYCIKIQSNSCSVTGNACCKNTTTSSLLIDVDENCMYETFTATLNGKAVKGVTIGPPSKGFGTRAVLTIPGLKLDAKALGANGATVCITLPKASACGSVDRLIPGGISNAAAWNATLLSSDLRCCPVTSLRQPPPVPCETCWVWDVIPGKKTSGTSYDFLSRNSCPLASLEPEYMTEDWKNCCEFEGYFYKLNYLDDLLAKGLATGFGKAVCNATSLRLCGNFTSMAAAQGLASERAMMGGLPFDFDNTDDTCPMGLIGSTVRLRSVQPTTGALDTRCAPVNEVIQDLCWLPSLKDDMSEGMVPFPNSTCNSAPGVTPFAMSMFYEVSYFNRTRDYCINITTTTPKPAKSTCANATILDRMSFWIIDDDWRRDMYLGAYLLTLERGSYTRMDLNASWGNLGEQVYNVHSLGLDVATVNAKKPKICIVRDPSGQLWYDTVSGIGYLWTALYDKSGKCCPVYYANRF
ncbi:hypothetical protein VOLCADRAFT_89349 [Volvox carteri f. nagariensis]|uniref:Pherophorin domain-containing protein n=1 Tax=Volvox carteri f. nagariensis TaxID=3068 RepID=D8TRH2_VOLCA|nr:uncharacterized protein VOLCADRAFT_89349 [Volvox carteri f. nagariensis]EFJ49893.1 hypothetical protein VOLCADRAFT_89349 [Volvox carteri f. nagariensis]|eukprot:XP_002948958.1 hypothetical protein VOLCADRAFT_89349 [Volvox carteri f. nagariensis]